MKKSTIAIIAAIIIFLLAVVLITKSNNSSASENSNNNIGAVAENNNSDNNTPDENNNSKSVEIPDEAKKFFEDYTNLQNEVSRNVELGNFSEEQYMDFLQKGIEIAQLKDSYENNEDMDALNKGIADVKPYLYEVAGAINSELKDNFKS